MGLLLDANVKPWFVISVKCEGGTCLGCIDWRMESVSRGQNQCTSRVKATSGRCGKVMGVPSMLESCDGVDTLTSSLSESDSELSELSEFSVLTMPRTGFKVRGRTESPRAEGKRSFFSCTLFVLMLYMDAFDHAIILKKCVRT